ncbi:hypothetical protein Plhal304r1_c003g0010481 [Plasmopara halstedii]
MDTQPPVFSGTLQVRKCRLLWSKTPVQLTYHRLDYRQALPVLLIRRSKILGGEIRIPLDPCIHPVRLLPVTKQMTCRLEFTLKYGWHTKQIWFRAPDAQVYQQWTSLVKAALESGRKPLATCDLLRTGGRPQADYECSSPASTINSSRNGTAKADNTIENKVFEETQNVHHHFNQNIEDQKLSNELLFVSDHLKYPSDTLRTQDVDITILTSAAEGSCNCENSRYVQPIKGKNRLWQVLQTCFQFLTDWSGITHELFLQASVFYFLK